MPTSQKPRGNSGIRPSVDGLYRDGTGQISRERRIKRFLTRRETANIASKPRKSYSWIFRFIGIYLRMFTRRISIFFVFFIFYSKRPSASLEPVMSLIFVPNRSASVRGVHRHQAIVILACHVSSENLCHLHGTTPFSIVCHAYFARTATVRADYCAFFQPISTTVFGGGGSPPVIVTTIQPKIGETSVKN